MSKTRYMPQDGVEGFLAFLSQQGMRVLAPVEKPSAAKPVVVFEPWSKGSAFTLAKANVAPKYAVLPECETLFDFSARRDPTDLNKRELKLADAEAPQPTAVFACRPCDARGYAMLDKPYMEGLYKDPYYTARRENLVVITLTCNSGCETCFCHWVGAGPTSPIGSDILMTQIEDGFVLQPITPKGAELLEKSSLASDEAKAAAMEATRKAAWATLVPAPKLDKARESLKAVFNNLDFWRHWTNRCLSCGACTYFCPTCYCFNITDEGEPASRQGGRRLRSWDNCMSSLYTREASGHNSRPEKEERMRNRVSHKFWTYPENWGTFLCSGCGRCITGCPVHLDIRAIVLAAIDEAAREAGE